MRLIQLANIGKVLEEKLMDADIKTAEQLTQIGAEKAFLRLSLKDDSDCYTKCRLK